MPIATNRSVAVGAELRIGLSILELSSLCRCGSYSVLAKLKGQMLMFCLSSTLIIMLYIFNELLVHLAMLLVAWQGLLCY